MGNHAAGSRSKKPSHAAFWGAIKGILQKPRKILVGPNREREDVE
jgi:hypothetical protein